ncbi:MAG: FecR domain-containing protein [Planctomycetota bacterium]|nr:FecR domain-containing protein [Planctomycetota bacterium]MDI6787368.1 FecR domain-containing protein [Planctomycetota bacterium]
MYNCERVQLELDSYLRDHLNGDEMLIVTEHLQTCSGCKESFSRIKKLSPLLLKWSNVEPAPDFVSKTNQKIDELIATSERETPFYLFFRRFRYDIASAVAVFLLTVIVWFVIRAPDKAANRIVLTEGTIFVQRGDNTDSFAIKGPYYVDKQDLIRTENQKAQIVLADKTSIEMDRKTALHLVFPYAQENSRGTISLEYGVVYLKATPQQKPLFIKTIAGNIKVIGTRLKVSHLKYPSLPEIRDRKGGGWVSDTSNKEGRIEVTTIALEEGMAEVQWKNYSYQIKPDDKVAFSVSIKPTSFTFPLRRSARLAERERGWGSEASDTANETSRLLEIAGQSLEDGDFDNAIVAEAILTSQGEKIVPYLIIFLKSTPVRKHSALYISRLLSRFGTEELYPTLKDIIKSQDYYIGNRYAAASSLVGINPESGNKTLLDLSSLGRTEQIDTEKICLLTLSVQKALSRETVQPLINHLVSIIKKDEKRNELLLDTAIETLSGISSPSALPILHSLLNNESDYRIIIAASYSIVRIEGEKAYSLLSERLYNLAESQDEMTKLFALKTLADMETPQVQDKLIKQLLSIGLSSKDFSVKSEGLYILAGLEKVQSFESFRNIIDLKNPDIILQAIQQVYRIISDDESASSFAMELLVYAYRDLVNRWKINPLEESNLKELADRIIVLLEGIRNQRCRVFVRTLLNDNDRILVSCFLKIIANIGEKKDIYILKNMLETTKDKVLRQEIMFALQTLKTLLSFTDE